MELLLALSTLSTGKIVCLALIAFIVGLVAGAQLTSHEERALDYNLEDVELDELKKIKAEAEQTLAALKGLEFIYTPSEITASITSLENRLKAIGQELFRRHI
jgi:hypothetical protein